MRAAEKLLNFNKKNHKYEFLAILLIKQLNYSLMFYSKNSYRAEKNKRRVRLAKRSDILNIAKRSDILNIAKRSDIFKYSEAVIRVYLFAALEKKL